MVKFAPAPKPEGSKKTKKKKESKPADIPKLNAAARTETNNRNRQFGKAVERQVAKLTGGERIPMSGAIKRGPYNLTGDVAVPDAEGRDLLKIECKGVSSMTAKGEKTFTIKKSVCAQAFREADATGEIPLIWVHFKNDEYEEDLAIIPGDPDKKEPHALFMTKHILELVRLAKLGAVVDRYGYWPEHIEVDNGQ